jgi:hypothetical protein
MKLDLQKFLTDPAHKENRDVLSGFVDHRVKEIVAERMKQKENDDDDKDDSDDKDDDADPQKKFASFFDSLFLPGKKKS